MSASKKSAETIANNAVLALDEACKQLYQLSAQFQAIGRARGNSPDRVTDPVTALASLGAYTAEDWANATDCIREECAADLAALAGGAP